MPKQLGIVMHSRGCWIWSQKIWRLKMLSDEGHGNAEWQGDMKEESQKAWERSIKGSSSQNTSGLHPLGRAVLIEPYEPEVRSSVIAIPDSVRANMQTLEQRAIVVEIGPACWPDEPPRARVGDRVIVSKLSGYMAVGPKDEKQYRFVNDRDIFVRIEE